MTERKEKMKKSRPAGKNDKCAVKSTYIGVNQEQTECLEGPGKSFNNEPLLTIMGFKENQNGGLSLPAIEHEFNRTKNGKIIKNKTQNGKISEKYGDIIEFEKGKVLPEKNERSNQEVEATR